MQNSQDISSDEHFVLRLSYRKAEEAWFSPEELRKDPLCRQHPDDLEPHDLESFLFWGSIWMVCVQEEGDNFDAAKIRVAMFS